jgi:hypothetical protein
MAMAMAMEKARVDTADTVDIVDMVGKQRQRRI